MDLLETHFNNIDGNLIYDEKKIPMKCFQII